MIINNIEVKNVRSIKEGSIEFKKGINILSGDPGQGKSSIIEQLKLHITNTANSNLDDIKNWKSKEPYTSYLNYSSNKDIIQSSYKYGTASSRKLVINDELDKTLNNSDAVKKLNEIFPVDMTLASMFSFQGENNLHEIKPAKRRDLIKNIFNLNFKNKIELIEKDIKNTKESIKTIEIKISLLKAKVYEIKDFKNTPITESELQKINEDLKSLELEKSEYNKRIEEYQKASKNLENLISEKSIKEKDLKSYEDKISEFNKKVLDTENDLQSQSYKSELKNLEETLNTKDFEKELNILIKETNAIVIRRLASYDSLELENIKKYKIELDYNITNLKKDIELYKTGLCSNCHQEIPESLLKEKKEELVSLISDLNTNTIPNYNKLLEDETKHKKLIEDNEILKTKKEVLENKITNEKTRIQTEKKTIEDKIRKEKDNIITTEKTLNSNIDDLKNRIVEQKELVIKVNTDINNVDKRVTELQNIINNEPIQEVKSFDNIEALKEQIELYNNITNENKVIDGLNKIVEEEKTKDTKEISNLNKSLISNTKNLQTYKEAKDFYKIKFPNHIIGIIIKSIKFTMNKFLAETYNGRYVIDIKEDNKQTGLDVLYGENYETMKDTINASGYEKSLLKLAWIIGLSKLSNHKLLILDEIDAAAPIKHSEQLYNVLMTYAKKEYDQIILISHKPEIRKLLKDSFGAIEFEINNGLIKDVD